ncbi:molybdopterin biosynthesis protein MoeY [Acidihalobacter aeolianus]|uniref:Molybdopterin biosynthesis protein MoeY n=1 Tax=Acidihalobacter aeolianus TaxID=2792603 RepID=A0A1D8K790_9GAMM|nr:molybdopterin biosynthesis protein MoeY [Acidihalobacter aeolianus]AOV16835.1 molybdopterin biosynthesis protein MoeY [Acidihalobacter aeolianus]
MTHPDLLAILDLARWAPSGDNTQCWRFEIVDETRFAIHGWDTRDWCVYDLDGHASQIAIGALLETIAIGASVQGFRAEFTRCVDCPESRPTIDVTLIEAPEMLPDPLAEVIERRVTQRRPLSTTPLSEAQKHALEASVGSNFRVLWLEGALNRWRMAKLLFLSARIRLTIPEAYEVHRRVIEWHARYSEDKIPDQAIGMDRMGMRLMRWAMQSWGRVLFLNRWVAGTWLPRLQLDLLPGYYCGAHALIASNAQLDGTDAYIAAGRAVQRFWLTATVQGLQFQPEMTPLIFSHYAREERRFSIIESAVREASSVYSRMCALFPHDAVCAGVFICRIGGGDTPLSRSIRLPLERLIDNELPTVNVDTSGL